MWMYESVKIRMNLMVDHSKCPPKEIIRITKMTKEMIEDVSNVHMEAFKGSMNTRLGKNYIKKFLEWFVNLEKAVKLVAIVRIQESERIVGYLVGAPMNYGKNMNRDLFWVASWSGCLRPWLLLNRQFRQTLMVRLTGFLQRTEGQCENEELPIPVMSLVGIGVLPNLQGQSIAKKLIGAFEQNAREMNVRSLRLSVYPENVIARHVYEKCGWVLSEGAATPGKSILYYRILV